MISSRVVPEREVFAMLESKGFEKTSNKTNTGTFWKHKATGRHLLVPFSVQGFCPDWWLEDLADHISLMGIDGL